MADLTTTITENVVLNGSIRGSSNSVTTTGITDCFERIVTCINGNVTTIAYFATQPYTAVGAIDIDRCRYIRVTNLDANGWIELAVVTSASNYQVLLTPGESHILCRAEAVVVAETDKTPAFGALENLESLQVKPVGVSYDPQVEIFVAVAE